MLAADALLTALDIYAEASSAENTRRAYRSDWAAFVSWCDGQGRAPLPASAETVALYLAAHAGELAVSTLGRRLATIRRTHRDDGSPVPDSGQLDRVWAGIRRTHGRAPRRKRALVTKDLKRALDAAPTTLAGLRDRALLLVGFAGALRRSELASLTVDGRDAGENFARFVSGGLELHIGRSKTDQEGRGVVVAVPHGRSKHCPVKALETWLSSASITSGPLFRPVDRWGRVSAEALSGAAVAVVVKAMAERAGLDPEPFAAHSLRAGLATSAAEKGVDGRLIQGQLRHAKAETTEIYIRSAEQFRRNAAGKVGL